MDIAGGRSRRTRADIARIDDCDIASEFGQEVRGAAAIDAGTDDGNVGLAQGVIQLIGAALRDIANARRLDRHPRCEIESFVSLHFGRVGQHGCNDRFAIATLAASHARARSSLHRSQRDGATLNRGPDGMGGNAFTAAHRGVGSHKLICQHRGPEQSPQPLLKTLVPAKHPLGFAQFGCDCRGHLQPQ